MQPMKTSFNLNDVAALYMSQPWWVWLVGIGAVWLAIKWLKSSLRAHRERSIVSADGFEQCGVRVDFRTGIITLPRGDSFPVQRVRELRWEDYSRAGFYHAIIDIGDLDQPIQAVGFSTSAGPEIFISRLRTAIEKAGGPRFSISGRERMKVVERDLSDPITAAVATRVRPVGERVSYSRMD